jgi:hypothetical protein
MDDVSYDFAYAGDNSAPAQTFEPQYDPAYLAAAQQAYGGYGGEAGYDAFQPTNFSQASAGPSQGGSLWDSMGLGKLTDKQKMMLGGGIGLLGLMQRERRMYGAPQAQKYDGPLSKYSFNPSTYQPYTYKPYAMGGLAQGGLDFAASGNNFAAGGGPGGLNMNALQASQHPQQASYAQGGIASLGGYSDGGQLLRGPGDGVSDSIPATIGGHQPARLADGEFVVPARIVSELGNGSTEAGARALYKMMDRIQQSRKKTTGKDAVAKNTNAVKQLPA